MSSHCVRAISASAFHTLGFIRKPRLCRLSRRGPPHQCAYFRAKKGIEHEFVLVSFGSGNTTSWMRIERAARSKRSAVRPRWDSAGPLFSGVPPLDTISFSTERNDLVLIHDVELASITIRRTASSSSCSGMFVRELSEHFAVTANDSPEYVLWSTNCRFFARRTMINIVVHLGVSHPSTVELRRGGKTPEELSIATFLSLMQAERFGGSALVGPRALIGRVKTLLYIASARGHNPSQALTWIEEALATLGTLLAQVSGVPANLKWLRSDCLVAKCQMLCDLELYEESFLLSQEALKLVEPDERSLGEFRLQYDNLSS